MLKIKLNKEVKSSHWLYYKPHRLGQAAADEDETSRRTLFVYNVPPYAAVNESTLRHVFSCFGRVEHVLVHAKPKRNPLAGLRAASSAAHSSYFKARYEDDDEDELLAATDAADEDVKFGFRVAYVVFADAEAVERAVTKPFGDKARLLQEPSNSASTIKLGLKSDAKHDFNHLQSFIESFLGQKSLVLNRHSFK